MDAIVSVNRPFKLAPGAFDGFPTGACIEAGFRGVLNCINDPLKLNPVFTSGENILLIADDLETTVESLTQLLRDPAELYNLAYRSYVKFHDVFGTDAQLWARSRLIVSELTRHVGLVGAPHLQRSTIDADASEAARLRTRITSLEQRQRQIEREQSLLEEKSKRVAQAINLINLDDQI
jgi:hypothetical protein